MELDTNTMLEELYLFDLEAVNMTLETDFEQLKKKEIKTPLEREKLNLIVDLDNKINFNTFVVGVFKAMGLWVSVGMLVNPIFPNLVIIIAWIALISLFIVSHKKSKQYKQKRKSIIEELVNNSVN